MRLLLIAAVASLTSACNEIAESPAVASGQSGAAAAILNGNPYIGTWRVKESFSARMISGDDQVRGVRLTFDEQGRFTMTMDAFSSGPKAENASFIVETTGTYKVIDTGIEVAAPKVTGRLLSYNAPGVPFAQADHMFQRRFRDLAANPEPMTIEVRNLSANQMEFYVDNRRAIVAHRESVSPSPKHHNPWALD